MALIKPSGSIAPTVYTKIKDQYYNSCVAMALSTTMDIFRAQKVGTDYENFSVSYIYGNGGDEDGMYVEEAIKNCMQYGSPRWDLVSTSFWKDDKDISEAEYTYKNADSYARANALKQRFSGYSSYTASDFYNGPLIARAIRNYGCFLLLFTIPENFYDVSSNGILPQPDERARTFVKSGSMPGAKANHTIPLIGLTTKNGKPHWIAQNSWGDYWGDSGYCYIPYDWGYYDNSVDWVLEGYSVWNNSVTSFVPASPTNVTDVQTGTRTARINWDSSLTGAMYTVFARRFSTNDWYIKGRTTNLSLNVSFDYNDVYYVKVLSSINDIYSDYSNTTSVTAGEFGLWEWTVPKVSGGAFNLTSFEWDAFCYKINMARQAHGLAPYSFTTSPNYIDKGKPFYAWIFLQAANAIKDLNTGVATEVLNVKSGDKIYAWYFDNLKTALNNSIKQL